MKTAVEWLVEELTKQNMFMHLFAKEIEQAKEMEKEQHEKTWAEGMFCETGDRQAFIEYYNETFKSEE
jgi:hypothetical protein